MTPAQTMWQQTTPLTISIALIVGIVIGYIYFKNLWWTVCHLQKSEKRKAFLFLSALPRLILFIIGLLLVSDKNVVLMGVYFLGFMIVKIVMVRHHKKNWKKLTTVATNKDEK